MEGYVDGKIAHCLLDTGSQVTLICNSLFQKLGRTLCPISDLVLWHGGSGTMPYFGWTQVNIGLDVGFCGTNESFRTLALVVPDGRDSDRHQLVVGTNSGVLRNCYRVVFGENPCRKGQTEVHPTCAKIYRDFEFSRKIRPDGSIGVIKLNHRGILIVPASSMKTVAGTLRSRVRRTTTVLIDTTTPRKLPGGLEVVCSLVKVGAGFNRVSVCLMNPTGKEVHLPDKCILAGAFIPAWTSESGCSKGANCSKVYAVSPDSPTQGGSDLPMTEAEFAKEWRRRVLKLSFPGIFSRNEWDVGLTEGIQHEIRLKDEQPFRERSRRVSPADLKDLRDHLQRLLDIGVVTESKSQYASPIVIVRKKNGTMRLCVDYRTLNSRTLPDQYTVPVVQDALDCLHGCKWFSVIDLKSGFYQIPMKPQDKEKTAFVCPAGFFQFERMPQGIKGAPATFQRLMERCMTGLNFEEVLV